MVAAALFYSLLRALQLSVKCRPSERRVSAGHAPDLKMPQRPDQLGGGVQPGGADQLDQNTIELAAGQASKMAVPAADAEAANGQPTMTSETLQAAAGPPAAAAA